MTPRRMVVLMLLVVMFTVLPMATSVAHADILETAKGFADYLQYLEEWW
ncbi:MAG TPA: hypothetical protein VK361_08685 [Rubrobacteraceae bacterium]|jgi:hypothetical protein|nr:hypothetical protein [Rubrobacteraceae bacterium]